MPSPGTGVVFVASRPAARRRRRDPGVHRLRSP